MLLGDNWYESQKQCEMVAKLPWGRMFFTVFKKAMHSVLEIMKEHDIEPEIVSGFIERQMCPRERRVYEFKKREFIRAQQEQERMMFQNMSMVNNMHGSTLDPRCRIPVQ